MESAPVPLTGGGSPSVEFNKEPDQLLAPATYSPEGQDNDKTTSTANADNRSNPLLELIVFPSKGEHTHTFIFLHGRGDSGRNFSPWLIHAGHSYGRRSSLQDILPGVKFIFPSSRKYPIEGLKNTTMPQWFHISSLSDTWRKEENQLEGLRVSVRDIHHVIREEMKVLPPHRIILGGLSQGCATALYSMLTFDQSDLVEDDRAPFGAMIGMSGWLPFYRTIQNGMDPTEDNSAEPDFTHDKDSNQQLQQTETLNALRKLIGLPSDASSALAILKTPVFIGHGAADPKVPPKNGELAGNTLRELGMEVKWRSYENFGHWIQEPDEVNDMIEFLKEKADVEVIGSKAD